MTGQQLKREREKRGWSREYVADRLEITARTVERWEVKRKALPGPVVFALTALLRGPEDGVSA